MESREQALRQGPMRKWFVCDTRDTKNPGISRGWLAAGLAFALILPTVGNAERGTSYRARVQYERGAHALRGGDLADSLVFLESAAIGLPQQRR